MLFREYGYGTRFVISLIYSIVTMSDSPHLPAPSFVLQAGHLQTTFRLAGPRIWTLILSPNQQLGSFVPRSDAHVYLSLDGPHFTSVSRAFLLCFFRANGPLDCGPLPAMRSGSSSAYRSTTQAVSVPRTCDVGLPHTVCRTRLRAFVRDTSRRALACASSETHHPTPPHQQSVLAF